MSSLPRIQYAALPISDDWEVKTERWQLSAEEIAKYGGVKNTIEGYLNGDQSIKELHPSQMKASGVGV